MSSKGRDGPYPRRPSSSSDTALGGSSQNHDTQSTGLDPRKHVDHLRRRSPSPSPYRHADLLDADKGRRSTSPDSNTNLEHEEDSLENEEPQRATETKDKPVSWRALPRKDQLFVLALARLSEPLASNSLSSYIYYQLHSFDPSLPDSTISYQAGVIHAAFPAAQFLTALLWGRFADSEYGGRKAVISIGLLGSMLSMIGFGFSSSFHMAVAFRCFGGILNGNIGVLRTMVSEIIKEKKYQARAFLIMPVTFNIGVIIGPILGGILADPIGSYPSIFGPGSFLGGKEGVQWMTKWPYALPNLMSATFLFISACSVLMFLEETHELLKDRPDWGLRIGRLLRRYLFRQRSSDGYNRLSTSEETADIELQEPLLSQQQGGHQSPPPPKAIPRNKLPFRRIWTRNLIMTILSHGLLALHLGTFNSLWYIYLSAPRYDPSSPYPSGFRPHGIHFTGGLALPPAKIGLAGGILGVIGITLQLLLYPTVSHRLGTVGSLRIFLFMFPLTYTLVPFLTLVPSSVKPPVGVSGVLVWICIAGVLFFQVLGRTFALPGTTILVNNCSPHPSVLGTVHGVAQSVSSLTRTVGPIVFAWLFGRGLEMGLVGLAWWLLAGVAIVGAGVGQVLWEGDGHEVLMEGEVRGADGVVRRV